MFTGIVEGLGKVTSIQEQAGGVLLAIDLNSMAKDLKTGDSVSVNGVCLTATSIKQTHCVFDVITETLSKTNLGELVVGSEVNIERSMKAGDRIEGHFVQGHVYGTGRVAKRIDTDQEFKLWVSMNGLEKYIAPLGCIAVNGVSLTVADIERDAFAVALIPTTLNRTNLGDLRVGSTVNLEPDIISRQIVHFLERRNL